MVGWYVNSNIHDLRLARERLRSRGWLQSCEFCVAERTIRSMISSAASSAMPSSFAAANAVRPGCNRNILLVCQKLKRRTLFDAL